MAKTKRIDCTRLAWLVFFTKEELPIVLEPPVLNNQEIHVFIEGDSYSVVFKPEPTERESDIVLYRKDSEVTVVSKMEPQLVWYDLSDLDNLDKDDYITETKVYVDRVKPVKLEYKETKEEKIAYVVAGSPPLIVIPVKHFWYMKINITGQRYTVEKGETEVEREEDIERGKRVVFREPEHENYDILMYWRDMTLQLELLDRAVITGALFIRTNVKPIYVIERIKDEPYKVFFRIRRLI